MAIKTINKLPVYEALVTDDETGMMRVSLVDAPAVDSDFIRLAKDRPVQTYRVESEERHLVRGVIMRADYPIFRRDDSYGEYYVIYRADTIRRMAEKYLAESRQNDVNVMHEDGSDVQGVRMVQWFIKDSAAGIAPEGFGDIEDGSLFAEYHVTNADVWDSIKDGTYKGFSLEGVFSLVPQEMRKETFNNEKIMVKRTKLSRIKAALAKAMLELGSVTTDKGIVSMQIWDTAGQEKYRSLTPMYYRNAHAAVLVFDVTNKESYESLEQWATDLEEKTTTDIKIFIAGNKCDLENRQVSEEEAREFAFKHGAICYVETSAKTGNGVLELFTKVAETCENVGKANAEQDRAVVSPGPATAQGGGGGGCQC